MLDVSKMERQIFRSRVTTTLSWQDRFTYEPIQFWTFTGLATLLFLVGGIYGNGVISLWRLKKKGISIEKAKKQFRTLYLGQSPWVGFLYLFWSECWGLLLYTLSIFFFFFWCVFSGYYRMHWFPSFVFGSLVVILSLITMSFSKNADNEYSYFLDVSYYIGKFIELFLVVLIFYKSNTFFTIFLGAIIASLCSSAVLVEMLK